MGEKLKIGILYLGLHNQLYKKFGYTIISRKELFIKLGKHGQIPKPLRPCVLKEMEQMKLIRKLDRDNLELLKIDIDIERDVGKLYELIGIY